MPELNEKLLNRLGIAEAMAHRAKATAGRLQQAAAKHHDAQNADIDALGKQIEAAGVGADEDAENRYCRALVARGRMAQAHHLAVLDAARMPEVGDSLEKGRISQAKAEAAGQGAMEFEENQHPRAAEGTAGRYKPGEFVPKGEQSDRVEAAAQSAQEDGHPGLASAHEGGVTDTPAFKKWFGDSQVVDSAGKPLVVYHGSPEKIEKFDPDLIFSKSKRADYGFGFYFSPHFNHAQVFSAHTPKGRTQAELGHVHSVYLSIQKPWQADESISRTEWTQFKQALPADALLKKNPAMLGLIDSIVKDGPAEQNRKQALFHSVVGMDTPEIEKKVGMEIRQALMKMGYDGVHGKGIMGYDGTYGGEEWVAFQPEQIKSAENEGTFDPKNPSINKAVRRTFHSAGQIGMEFDEEQHPREAKGATMAGYKPGEFVPKDTPEKAPWQQSRADYLAARPLPKEDYGWPQEGEFPFVVTDNGAIYIDKSPANSTHILFAEKMGIPAERIVSGGFLRDGELDDMGARSDAARYGEQARAKRRSEHRRAVANALTEGKDVPKSVLQDYPDMKKAVRSACEANELCRPFVPPDMPRWRGPRPSPNSYLPLNGVEDREKFLAMAKEMAAGTWTWDRPLIRCGDQLLTGSHRYAAAQMVGVPLETLDVDDLFKRCGLDFRGTWELHAQPYTSWLNNMDAALKTLPPEILALFGIDLG